MSKRAKRLRGLGSVYQPPNTRYWHVRYWQDGKRYGKAPERFETREDAEEWLSQRYLRERALRGYSGRNVSLGEMKHIVLANYVLRQNKTARHVELAFEQFEKNGIDLSMRARDLRQDQIELWVAARLTHAKLATVAKELAVLKRAYKLVRSRGVETPAFPELPTPDNARRGFFEWEDFQCIHNHLPPHEQRRMTFLYLTGWRISESCVLPWTQIDWDSEVVFLEPHQQKGGLRKRKPKRRIFPFAKLPDLKAVLEECLSVKEATERKIAKIIPWVFHDSSGDQLTRWVRPSWTTACEACGVKGRTPHDFRRTAARNLVRAGVPEKVACEMVGWSDPKMLWRYDITSSEDLVDAGKRLSAYLASQRKRKRIGPKGVTPIRREKDAG